MINTASAPASGTEKKGDVLKKITEQYALKDDKRDPVKKLGKDDFFKIMVTQLKNQDPTKPYDNEQMAAQMAQFTSLEQMFNMNGNLEKLAENQKPLYQLGATGLIGKFVTTDTSRVSHVEGKFTSFSFELPADANNVRVNILNEKGETIREITQASLKKGPQSIDWDGKQSNGMNATSGSYMMQVRAEATTGKPMNVVTTSRQQVVGVGFEGKDTALLVGNPKSPQKVLLRAVSRIESDFEAPAVKPQTVAAVQAIAAGEQGGQEANGQQTDGQQTQANTAPSADEQPVPGKDPGQTSKFMPFDLNTMKGLFGTGRDNPADAEKNALAPVNSDDLTAANPAAAALAASMQGKAPAL
jgi:flagellar hook assembly protein FlgD